MFQQTTTNTAMHKQTDKPHLENVLFTCKHTTNHLGIIQMTFDHQTAKIQRKRTPHNEKLKYFSLRITLINSFKKPYICKHYKMPAKRKDIKAETICNFSNC